MVGPTPKQRAGAPCEAPLNAKAHMAGQYDDHAASSPALNVNTDNIPEMQGQSSGNLPLSGSDLNSITTSVSLNNSTG